MPAAGNSSSANSRLRERTGSAALRAVGASPTAELRAHQLRVGDTAIPIAVPYLSVDLSESTEGRRRGVVDGLAVRLRFSVRELHDDLAPDDLIARLVFDQLEQIRCEALVPFELSGVRDNIEGAFRSWCDEQELSESGLGLLIYTVIHMARSRLVHPLQNEMIEDSIESTRANISPIIGTQLRELKAHIFDQDRYAVPALEIAVLVASLADEEAPTTSADRSSVRGRLFIPPEWAGPEEAPDGENSVPNSSADGWVATDERGLDEVGGYHVFMRVFDREVDAATLYPAADRLELRSLLDEQIAAQSVSPFALARRLQILFAGSMVDGWRVGQDDGVLDANRLSQLVANPNNRQVFKQSRYRVTSPVVVSFLIDNSGSMKRQRHETVTVLVDTLARALDLAGATSEVLGFTTAAWNGGEPLREWRRAGEPPAPGRLAELCHIVYKDADTPWKRSRTSIATMMRTRHFRESIDGEAIVWAHRRLLARPEPRKILVVVSDGAPMEAATMNANGEAFLETHLRNVVSSIERDARVEIGAISIDLDVDEFFSRSVDADLTGTLTLADYAVLERLFPH